LFVVGITYNKLVTTWIQFRDVFDIRALYTERNWVKYKVREDSDEADY
jgi:hypothetical protein